MLPSAPPRGVLASTPLARIWVSHLWVSHLAALVLYLLLTVVFTWPLALHLADAIPGDGFDGWQNYWNLWWIKQALVDRLSNPLAVDLLYAPTGVTLYFHTLNPFNGLSTLPVQLAWGLIPAYNAVVLFSWVLGGYGMFLLSRWVLLTQGGRGQAGWWGPFLAGLVYTFSPFHMAHLLGHMQVMSLQWMPFYSLALLRSLERARLGRPWHRSAGLAGLYLVFTGLCDWYFVLYLFLFTGLAVLWSWLAPPGRPRLAGLMRLVWPPLLSGLLFALLLSFWLIPMVGEALRFRFMVRPSSDLYILSVSVSDFLIPSRLHTLWRPASFTWSGNQIAPVSERTVAIGYVALGLAAAAWLWARRSAGFWLLVAFSFGLLALGPQMHWGNIGWEQIPPAVQRGEEVASGSPYGVLNQLIPFMRISRSVSRFAVMVQLSLAVLAGLGGALLLRRLRGGWAAGVAGLLLALLIFEYWVAPYPLSPPDTPAYYNELAADPDPRALLNLPMNYDRPGYLLYQTVHGKPLTAAYISRDDPRTLVERLPLLQHFRHLGPDILADDPVEVAPSLLADLGVGTVVLDRYKMPGGMERTYTEALASAIFAGQSPVYVDERITVYKVAEPGAVRPYLGLGALHWGPLQTEGGRRSRTLLGSPAALQIHHPPAQGEVTLHYRSTAGAALVLRVAGAVEVLARSAADSDGTLQLDLAAALAVASARQLPLNPLTLQIEIDGDGDVAVEQIRLSFQESAQESAQGSFPPPVRTSCQSPN